LIEGFGKVRLIFFRVTSLETLERRLAERPKIAVPGIALQGDVDGVNPSSSSEGQDGQFTEAKSDGY
jgi:hypothetical protein